MPREIINIMSLAYEYDLDPIPQNGFVVICWQGRDYIIKRLKHLQKLIERRIICQS